MSTRDELLAESPLDIISAMSESEVCSFMPPSKLLIWYGDEKAGGEEREEKRSAAVSPITAMDPKEREVSPRASSSQCTPSISSV